MESFENFEGWEFLEIFNFDLFSTFYETVCTKSTKLNLFCTNNSRYCYLLVESTTRHYNEIFFLNFCI